MNARAYFDIDLFAQRTKPSYRMRFQVQVEKIFQEIKVCLLKIRAYWLSINWSDRKKFRQTLENFRESSEVWTQERFSHIREREFGLVGINFNLVALGGE